MCFKFYSNVHTSWDHWHKFIPAEPFGPIWVILKGQVFDPRPTRTYLKLEPVLYCRENGWQTCSTDVLGIDELVNCAHFPVSRAS